MSDTPWNKWLDETAARARSLLAANADRQAAMARSAAAPLDDIAKARELQKALATAVTSDDADAWRLLAVAFDVINVAGVFEDEEPAFDNPVDSTIPEAPPMTTASKTESFGPSHNIDQTVVIGEMRIELGELPTPPSPDRQQVDSTHGAAPPPAVNREQATVPLPVHMPAQVTATSAAASAARGGTTPMRLLVPSSVLDIERYAMLCALTHAYPKEREALHQQYGLSNEDERIELDARFAALFANDSKLKSAFETRLRLHLSALQR